jgi:hypothetical protein
MSGGSLGTPVDVRPKPRAVLIPADSESAPVVQGIFPYEHVVVLKGEEIHDEDWDVMVTESGALSGCERLLVVGFGLTNVDGAQQWSPSTPGNPGHGATAVDVKQAMLSTRISVTVNQVPTPSHNLIIPDGLDPFVERLVRNDLVPGFKGGQPWLPLSMPSFGGLSMMGYRPDWYLSPLLSASNGAVLAARVRRSRVSPRGQHPGEVWILPPWVTKHRDWVRAAWKVWAETYPGLIPSPSQWEDSEAWFTPSELVLHKKIEIVRTRREETVARLDAEEASLRKSLTAATQTALVGARRLLSADGDALVEAVQAALQDLGFSVVNMDEVTVKGKRVEDLRISDGDWSGIAEVKGHKRGAPAGDLIKITRFAGLYENEMGHQPAAQWYIVNAFRFDEPGARPVPLEASPEDVEVFGDGGGVIISTVDLFRVWRDVMTGVRMSHEVREAMKTSHGRFTG